jgi:hypothetical protein
MTPETPIQFLMRMLEGENVEKMSDVPLLTAIRAAAWATHLPVA